jgi:hypothetical protein
MQQFHFLVHKRSIRFLNLFMGEAKGIAFFNALFTG